MASAQDIVEVENTFRIQATTVGQAFEKFHWSWLKYC